MIFALGLLLGAATADAASCQVGSPTGFASGCVNAFPADGKAIYSWDPEKFGDRVRTLFSAECATPTVVAMNVDERMAQIECRGIRYWTNLDTLSCNPLNAQTVQPRKELYECETCSRMRNGPNSVAQEAIKLSQIEKEMSARSGHQIVERAERRMRQVQSIIDKDYFKLAGRYAGRSHKDLAEDAERAVKYLRDVMPRTTRLFGPDCQEAPAKWDSDAVTRGQSICKVLRDSLKAALEIQDAMNPLRPRARMKFVGNAFNDRIVSSGVLGRLDAESLKKVLSPYDDLVTRMVMFAGLTRMEQDAIVAQANPERLAYFLPVKELANADGRVPMVLHSGYVFGGSRVAGTGSESAYDCSDFVSTIIRGDRRSFAPSTLVFKNVARYLAGERSSLSSKEKQWASCFDVVRIRRGEHPQAGDIAVSRTGADGHIVLVRSYDFMKGNIETIEAAGGSRNTVGIFSRPVFEPSCRSSLPGAEAPVRADLEILRIKASPGKECPFRPDPQ